MNQINLNIYKLFLLLLSEQIQILSEELATF